MKTSFRIMNAALAAGLTLVMAISCDKDINGGKESGEGQTAEGRAISVSFAPAGTDVKTTTGPDGLTPIFNDGDKIMVSNGDAYQECTVSANGTERTIYTALTGALTAVYPSSSAKISGNGISGIIIPAEQSGEFADANICMATVGETGVSAQFKNVTALFKITPPSGTKKLEVKSLKSVVDGVARTGSAWEINTSGSDDEAKCIITVGSLDNEPMEDRPYYVSVSPGVKLSDLAFDAATDMLHGSLKGIPEKDIKAKADAAGVEFDAKNVTTEGTVYTISRDEGWHQYASFGNVKWSIMNIGAESITDVGLYFAWGALKGHKLDLTTQASTPASKPVQFEGEYGFGENNYNIENPGLNNKYNETDGKVVLDLQNDAAYYNWGGPWRMPTSGTMNDRTKMDGDYASLVHDSVINYFNNPDGYEGTGKNGQLFTWKKGDSKIFFPAPGHTTENFGVYYYNQGINEQKYWSSSLSQYYKKPMMLKLFEYSDTMESSWSTATFRYGGTPIRPVADF